MKDDASLSKLREAAWRRKLTEGEQAELRARLAADPGARADWEAEAALSAALNRLPEAPVPSNFTARVMLAVECEEAKSRRGNRRWFWFWHALMPRVAVATAGVALCALMLHHHAVYTQRVALARNVALVVASQPVPSREALENFDAIRRMSQPQQADEELLTLMQ